jgi:hypothetical protein
MCAEASTVLRAVAADFFCNCWCLEIPSNNRIRNTPRCLHYHAQGFLEERLDKKYMFRWRRATFFPACGITKSRHLIIFFKSNNVFQCHALFTAMFLIPWTLWRSYKQTKQTPWSESASELYRPSDRRVKKLWSIIFAVIREPLDQDQAREK